MREGRTAGNEFEKEIPQALVDILPNGQRRVVEGQDHAVAPEGLAPVLVEFFRNGSNDRSKSAEE